MEATNFEIREIPRNELIEAARQLHRGEKSSLCSSFCSGTGPGEELRLNHIFALRAEGRFVCLRVSPAAAEKRSFPALSPFLHAANWFEREMRDLHGVEFENMLDPRPLVFFPENWPAGLSPDQPGFKPPDLDTVKGVPFAYEKIKGDGTYEIPVGPVHAGVIEPGHFRFSVAGEPVLKLEARLFWNHKGIEKLFEGRDPFEAVCLAERISGDESLAHALAYLQSVEALCGIEVSERAEYLRGICAELERISMHLFDIGNICVGTAFNFGAAHLWRLKESLMRELDTCFGSRFLRNVLVPGGVSRDLQPEQIARLSAVLKKVRRDAWSIIKMIQRSSSILDRLQTTAPLLHEVALDFAAVGPVARGSGVAYDMRIHFPYSIYRKHRARISTEEAGDVYARTQVRIRELDESLQLLDLLLEELASGSASAHSLAPDLRDLPVKDGMALGWAEAPRGQTLFYTEIRGGKLSRVKLSSASFLNWHCMPQAISGMIVPDFPLLNKSFGLSYSGCDR